MTAPLRIFVSYAHTDESFKERLISHLTVLRRKNLVAAWHDRQIDGGADWRQEILTAMDDCSLALLLVSDAFLTSEFIQSQEMEHLWQRRLREEIRLAPIIVRPCAWELDDKLCVLQALPKDGRPVITFPQDNGERDQTWTDITRKIADWAKKTSDVGGAAPPTSPPPALPPSPPTSSTVPVVIGAPTSPPPAAKPKMGWQGLLGAVAHLFRGISSHPLHDAGEQRPSSDPPLAAVDLTAAPPQATAPLPAAALPMTLTPTVVNPFNPWDEAVPPRFVGRADLLRRLKLALDEKRSLSLVGDWRIGKSSVLQTWRLAAEESGRVVRLVSGEGPEAVSCAALVTAVSGQPAPAGDPDAADEAADRLSLWLDAVSPAGLPPLILIDEADRMLTRFPPRFFERLRGMLGRVCLVLATRQEVDRIYESDNRTSPFINRLEMQRLALLDQEAAEALIAQGGEILRDEDRELMRTWAGCHPYYLALLGRHLWDARQQGNGTAEALEIFRDEARARLRELWRGLDDEHRQQLRSMLDGKEVDSELIRRGMVVAGQAFGKVMTEWLRNK